MPGNLRRWIWRNAASPPPAVPGNLLRWIWRNSVPLPLVPVYGDVSGGGMFGAVLGAGSSGMVLGVSGVGSVVSWVAEIDDDLDECDCEA